MFCDTDNVEKSFSFKEIWDKEKKLIDTKKEKVHSVDDKQANAKSEQQLIGLAFSGGGIRSATINLGILQSLAKHDLINCFDYLSTVSGGGYIGAYLSAMLSKNKWDAQAITRGLDPSATNSKLNANEDKLTPSEMIKQDINWLRSYSNYLTPKAGIFSTDTLAAFSQWLCNSLVNQVLLASSLLIIFILVNWFSYSADFFAFSYALTFLEHIRNFLMNLSLPNTHTASTFINYIINCSECYSPQKIQLFVGALLLTFGLLGAYKLSIKHPKTCPFKINWKWICAAGGLGSVLLVLYSPINACETLCFLKSLVAPPSQPSGESIAKLNLALGLGVPLFIGFIYLAIMTIMGFGGRSIPSPIREWWHRMGGVTIAVTLTWFAVFFFAVYFPLLISYLDLSSLDITVTSVASYLFAFASAKIGQSKVSSATDASAPANRLLKFLPYFIIVLIFTGFGYASHQIYHSNYTRFWFISLLIIFLVGNRRFDINIFSLHNFYRNRLTRCYLGATNNERLPNSFTGFDDKDDLRFAELKNQRPIHIINTALNISDGSELAWQQRKAASFTFTPCYSGFQLPDGSGGYRKTDQYADKKGGPMLGSLIAVSGAAVSPNMGYHTNPVMAFIMTLFNARLGRWFGNPSKDSKTWQHISPKNNFAHLLNELFINTNAKSPYLYLSDGGHFENLGIYELIRRKCKLIVAIDAGEDGNYQFDDLGNAIRKCETDLDVRIKFDDLNNLHPSKQSVYGSFKHSEKHYAIGEILYSKKDPKQENGILLYIKSSLTGTEPADLINYKLQEPTFPHHSTVDQFFDESQFESYRRLGEHIAKAVMFDIEKSKNSKAKKNLARDTYHIIETAKK